MAVSAKEIEKILLLLEIYELLTEEERDRIFPKEGRF